MTKFQQRSSRTRLIFLAIAIVLTIVGILCGYFIGRHSVLRSCSKGGETDQDAVSGQYSQASIREVAAEISPANIKENLRYLTQLPHPPGEQVCDDQARHLHKLWKEQGLDDVQSHKYNIYLSFPNRPARIQIAEDGVLKKELIIDNEPVVDESEALGNVLYPFNAYSPSGTVSGELVYGNYGSNSDFAELEKRGVDVRGKILLLRYGGPSRSAKVSAAQLRGSIGVIIFTDLSVTTIPGQEYPKGWMANENAIQRGTINTIPGDALTVGYPAKDNYFRLDESKEKLLPKIPTQPISFAQAREIFSLMSDSYEVPESFKTGFSSFNLSYRLLSGNNISVTLIVDTRRETRATYTVCGKLYGRSEKDRYVLFGNHRDSWTHGASDPSSGTACLMELVRVLGQRKIKTGWRPRRSVMFCSWDAEEVGTLGSTEWADDHHRFITQNVVAYLNVDMAVEGNFTVRMRSLNIVEDGIFDAAKNIAAPDNPAKSLYQDWLEKTALQEKKALDKVTKPRLFVPTAGSDYKCFWHTYGTTIADYRYLFSKLDFPFLGTNGHYHTRYESFGWMTKYVDPDLRYHTTIAKLWFLHGVEIAESLIVPFNLVKFCLQAQVFLKSFDVAYWPYLQPQNISLAFALERLEVLLTVTQEFSDDLQKRKDTMTLLELRSANDKIMNFERNFLHPGLTRDVATRHVIYASPKEALVSGEKFPGITQAIHDAVNSRSDDGWDHVRRQITILTWCIDTAITSLSA